jgi:hypothetical protein
MSEEKNNFEEKTDSIDQGSNENASQEPAVTNETELTQHIDEASNLNSSLNREIQVHSETSQPLTDMETHHHPHVHHSKKWKDYLFEFVMLFLAVTTGFLVENKREHYIEHQRARQFSKQLIADLRLDSALFEDRSRTIQSMQKGYDSLQYLLTGKSNVADKEILKILLPLAFAFDVPATASTYNQMKTSGSLRYIENADLTNHLQHYYDVLLPRCIRIAEASLTYFSDHINPFYLKHIRIQDFDPFNDSLINDNPVLINRNKDTDQELANIMGGYRSLLKIQAVTMNEPALKKIKETIPILKTEYDLE